MASQENFAISLDSGSAASATTGFQKNTTFFSTREFAEAWSRSFGDQYRPLAIPVRGSGPPRIMYVIQVPARYGSRYVPLTRYDFFSSPGWEGNLEQSTLDGILRKLMGFRTRGFVWNVRFDHEPLAAGLASLGLKFQRISTRVVPLCQEYERVFAGYNATIRNQIKSARRRGVLARVTVDSADIIVYHDVYTRHARHKDWSLLYPVELSVELAKVRNSARFVVAEYEGRIIAGGLFVRDGLSVVYYLHGVTDRVYSHVFPSCAVIDEGIRWACETGATYFNLGMSGGIASLEQFKSFWGAHAEFNWTFEWSNPVWARLHHFKSAAGTSLNVFRYK